MSPISFEEAIPRDSFVDVVDAADDAAGVAFDADLLTLASLNDSRQAICVTDARVDLPGPTISFVNRAYTDIFRCHADDVIGKTPRFGQGPLTNRRVLDRLRAHLESGESVEAQAINYRFDRTSFRLRWSIDPLRQGGATVGFVAHMRDVTLEDRVRRRLAALDTLMSRGRVVATLRSTERDEPVAAALAASLRPVIAEIATATVRVGAACESSQIDADVMDGVTAERAPDVIEVPIGSSGVVTVDVHPDADALIDRLAITELAAHAAWLLELGDPTGRTRSGP